MAEDVLVILQKALAKEEERSKFYTEAAQRTCNPLAQATFNVLAGEELKHRDYITRFYNGMVEKKHWPDMSACATKCLMAGEAAHKVWETVSQDQVQDVVCDSDLSSAYEIAMETERESIALYRGLMEQAADENAQAFYSVLLGAERGHLQLLSKTQEFLDEPHQWYRDEEEWIVEG